ncbi:hypothetical protein GCM10018953_08120 [Streptosporangium nondiastaticum]
MDRWRRGAPLADFIPTSMCRLLERSQRDMDMALKMTKVRVWISVLTWAFARGADDGNRTRAVSLGIASIMAHWNPELGSEPVLSDRGGPLAPLLMAR